MVHHVADDVYETLATHLDTLTIPFPRTTSEIEIKILKRWFTPEEARIAAKIKGAPEPVEEIAKRMGEPLEIMAPALMRMSKKGLLYRKTIENRIHYNIVPLAEGMWEFHLNSMDKAEVAEFHQYMDTFMEQAWFSTPTTQHRVIPVSTSIPAQMEVMGYDHAETIIQGQSRISVANCICRKQNGMLHKDCGHPLESCMAFGDGATYFIENGLGREVSQEEALMILNKAMEAGLVLQPGNGQKVWSICMCCGCACVILKTLKKMDAPAKVVHTSFYAQIDEDNCTACGICQDRCPMDAVHMDDTAEVDADRCIGCGVCIGACEFDAAHLMKKAEDLQYIPPETSAHMHRQIILERKG